MPKYYVKINLASINRVFSLYLRINTFSSYGKTGICTMNEASIVYIQLYTDKKNKQGRQLFFNSP